jgi:pimeloyl-ACP methyl ester carboxylesterase
MSSFVLVHGICHGGWCWERTSDELRRRDHDVTAVDLPLTSLEADAATVARALGDVDGPSILVGHSYGGLVISKAAAGRDDVEHLVYVAAVMLDGDDVLTTRVRDFPSTPLGRHTVLNADGNVVVTVDAALACFYNECDEAEARKAAVALRPTSPACFAVPTGSEPWHTVPSTYVLSERDLAIHPDFQRWMSTRAGRVVTFDTDHSPFLSTPEPFVDLLDGIARGTG